MDWDLPSPHLTDVTVHDRDIDGMGHANNAAYVIWCERAAWNHSHELGLSVADYRKLNRGVAIHHAEYDYHQPSFAGEGLRIATWLTGCDGKLRLERRFQIRQADGDATILRGRWQLICINVETGRPTSFPDAFLRCYGDAVVEPHNS